MRTARSTHSGRTHTDLTFKLLAFFSKSYLGDGECLASLTHPFNTMETTYFETVPDGVYREIVDLGGSSVRLQQSVINRISECRAGKTGSHVNDICTW